MNEAKKALEDSIQRLIEEYQRKTKDIVLDVGYHLITDGIVYYIRTTGEREHEENAQGTAKDI